MERDAEQSWAGKHEPLTRRRRNNPRTSIDTFETRQRRKLAQAVEALYHRLDSQQRVDLQQLLHLVRNEQIAVTDAQRLLADVEYQLDRPLRIAA